MTGKGGLVRVGADIGGTFTDVALEVGDRLVSTKLLTTHAAPEAAIVEGIAEVARQAGIAPEAISCVIHGTTLATNALIERRGAKTAFITTKGFRDVVEMRTENRFEQYDLNIVLPPPLISREHRYVVDERVDAGGQVLKPHRSRGGRGTRRPHCSPPATRASPSASSTPTSTTTHERLCRDVLRAKRPGLPVSISCEVSPQMREFERFNTVCANAFVQAGDGFLSAAADRRPRADRASAARSSSCIRAAASSRSRAPSSSRCASSNRARPAAPSSPPTSPRAMASTACSPTTWAGRRPRSA